MTSLFGGFSLRCVSDDLRSEEMRNSAGSILSGFVHEVCRGLVPSVSGISRSLPRVAAVEDSRVGFSSVGFDAGGDGGFTGGVLGEVAFGVRVASAFGTRICFGVSAVKEGFDEVGFGTGATFAAGFCFGVVGFGGAGLVVGGVVVGDVPCRTSGE